MAAIPKLSLEQWGEVRARWEADRRDGYAWLVEELSLPVSAPGVRKTALRDGWAKKVNQSGDDGLASRAKPAKVSKASKVSPRKVSENHYKVSETMPETEKPTVAVPDAQPSAFDQITDMEGLFVREYTIDWNGTRAAARAGYSERSASSLAYQMLQKPSVQAALRELMADRFERLGIDGDAVIQLWESIATVNANEISQFRRLCCRHCWGEAFGYQYTPGEFQKAKIRHEEKRAELLGKSGGKSDIGDFLGVDGDWYQKHRDPNPECPECFGEGVGETFLQDTRKLSPAALAMYAGVKEGREGIEILTNNQEKARENLARVHGLFKDKEAEVNINLVAGDDLHKMYAERMDTARARQERVLVERGIIEGSAVREPDQPEDGA